MFHQSTVFLLIFSVVHCLKEQGIHQLNTENENDKIAGGTFAAPGEFPWMVSLKIRLSNKGLIHSCGGSVLDEFWIITAAHCVSSLDENSLVVVAGEYDLNSDDGFEQMRFVERIVPHSGWDSHLIHHDIALLKLVSPLDLSSRYVSPISLPVSFQASIGPCIATGWGLTEEGGAVSPILKKASLFMADDSICSKFFPENFIKGQFCTKNGDEGNSPCSDDSGGPLVCKNSSGKFVLSGIVSYGFKCGFPQGYSYFTDVAYYIDWIERAKHP